MSTNPVPDKPRYAACPDCDGTGEDDDIDGSTQCRRCKGFGVVLESTLTTEQIERNRIAREVDDEMRNNVDFGD